MSIGSSRLYDTAGFRQPLPAIYSLGLVFVLSGRRHPQKTCTARVLSWRTRGTLQVARNSQTLHPSSCSTHYNLQQLQYLAIIACETGDYLERRQHV